MRPWRGIAGLRKTRGKRVSFDRGEHWTTIVGVVGDAKEYGLDRQVGDETLSVPLRQAGFARNLVIRTAIDPMTWCH